MILSMRDFSNYRAYCKLVFLQISRFKVCKGEALFLIFFYLPIIFFYIDPLVGLSLLVLFFMFANLKNMRYQKTINPKNLCLDS
jgi:hypothetical protein